MLSIYQQKCTHIPATAFSWKLRGDIGQHSYRITVYDTENRPVWDSGEVVSAWRHNIPCGVELPLRGTYRWQVTVTGADGSRDSAEGETFHTALPAWTARWVEPDRVRKPLTDKTTPTHGVIEQKNPEEILDSAISLRRSFHLDALPEQALLYATAHGVYGLSVNGVTVSDLMAPGYTSYGKRIEYQCYDVGGLLRSGENVIAATLTDGWYTGKIGAVGIGQQYGTENALLFQLELGRNGSWQSVGSDAQVRFAPSAWKYADLFVGACYDEAAEQPGWMLPGFDDSGWQDVRVCDYGMDTLHLQTIPPVREQRTIQPRLFTAPNGDLMLDAGEVIVGYVSFTLPLHAGDTVRMEHTEVLDKAGNFIQNIVGQNKNQTDVFYCHRSGLRAWQPAYTYHGFRYVRLTGVPAGADAAQFTVHVLHTPIDVTGQFRCSDARLNQLQENILRSQSGNMICIPTDCPQREKTGWTGDMQVYAPTACYEMDVEQFVRHWLEDMALEQLPDGQMPHIIPYIPSHDIMKPAWIDGVSAGGWSDAAVIVPWRLYEAYGDVEILRENYPMMKRYMDSLRQRVATQPQNDPRTDEHLQYIWNNDFQYGDWLMPSTVKSGLVGPAMMQLTGFEAGTLMVVYTNTLMEKICQVLGLTAEAEAYAAVARKTREAFCIEFANPDGTLKKEFQGLYVLALAMDAIPEALRENTVRKLVELIHANGDRLDTGFLSIPFLLPVLSRFGEQELANRLLFQEQEPSWLYEIKMGATTLWESWDAIDPDGNPKPYSFNHFAFGCVGEYLFGSIAGINAAEPGFGKVRIAPDFTCGLSEVACSYDSLWGEIAVHWTQTDGQRRCTVTLPPDVTGVLVLDGQERTLRCGTQSF